ncbi:hypothetical protein D560_2381 [Bordetella holmesii ATCC 51541]|nr:hypothetical protein D560_2381 [Bordetella holmesii ATCC 51541]
MLWVKTFHIVFVVSWFAGLFYLPRIFVNLAQHSDPATQSCLLGMARRLYRFMTIIAVPAILLGLWLYVGYRIGVGRATAGCTRSCFWCCCSSATITPAE